MKLLIDSTGVLLAFSKTIENTAQGFYIPERDVYFPQKDLSVFEVSNMPGGITPLKYKYQNGGFAINTDYSPPTQEREIMTLQEATKAKLLELSHKCNATITAGCDVTLSDGTTGHISMKDEDQINLIAAQAAVQAGQVGYPYHLDGDLCKVYPAADIVTMATAATQHKLYHTTYCNHLNVWVRRCETVAEVQAIKYGSKLPDDLMTQLADLCKSVGIDITKYTAALTGIVK